VALLRRGQFVGVRWPIAAAVADRHKTDASRGIAGRRTSEPSRSRRHCENMVIGCEEHERNGDASMPVERPER
jgi:hypothetical protein